mgnify:CR=1 FL=1
MALPSPSLHLRRHIACLAHHHHSWRQRTSVDVRGCPSHPNLHLRGELLTQLLKIVDDVLSARVGTEAQGQHVGPLAVHRGHHLVQRRLQTQGDALAARQRQQGLRHQQPQRLRCPSAQSLCQPLRLRMPLPLRNPTCRSARKAANANASSATCERAEMACEEVLDREARQHLPSSGRFKSRSSPLTLAITDRLASDFEMASAIDSGVDPSGYSRFEPSGKDTLIMGLTFVFRGRIKHFAGSLNPPSGNDFQARS